MKDDPTVSEAFGQAGRPGAGLLDDIMRERVGARLFSGLHGRTSVGRFLLRGQLGQGGGGAVYEADDPQLGRRVAIKVFSDRGGDAGVRTIHAHAEALRAEARMLAQLSHPNIVRVFEVDEHRGDVFIVMERIEGTDLFRWLGTHGQDCSFDTKLGLLHGAALGLQAAHRLDIVHGDVKPSNILVDETTTALLADFGLAVQANTPSAADSTTVAGTPSYMAPEQHGGSGASVQTDIYAFCITAIEVLTAQRVHAGRAATISDEAKRERIEVALVDVPKSLRTILRAGTEIDPERRLHSMDPLVEALAPRRRWSRVAIGSIALGVAGLGTAVAMALAGPETACQPRPDQIDEVWGPAQRRGVIESFEQTGLAFASNAAQHTSAALDVYAERWARAVGETCESRETISDDAFYLRAACFNRSLAAMASLVGALEGADPRVVESATGAASALPRLEDCRNPPPSAVLAEGTDDQLLTELARAKMTASAGMVQEATPVLRELEQRARDADPTVHAKILMSYADAVQFQGEFESARELLEQAYAEAVGAAETELSVVIAARLAGLVGYALQRLEAGETWVRVAVAGAQRLPSDSPAHVAVLRARSDVLFRQSRFSETLPLLFAARERLEADRSASQLDLVTLLNDIAATQIYLHRYDEARELLRRALRLGRDVVGEGHPMLAEIYYNLGSLERLEGRLQLARGHIERALGISGAARGPMHDAVAMPTLFLADLGIDRGELEAAREGVDRAYQILTTLHPGGTIDLASHARIEGKLLLAQGDVEGSIAKYRRAIEIVEEISAAQHPRLSKATAGLSRALRAAGRHEEALEMVERAEATARVNNPGTMMQWSTMLDHAQLLHDVGRNHEARPLLESVRQGLADMDGEQARREEARASTLAAQLSDASAITDDP
ncbi:MAG: serine/threonine-protein kinase [Myxococcota bacterium]